MTKLMMAALARRSIFAELKETLGASPSGQLQIEILAGLTVALALVPEAVAFAFVAGVHPLVGLYAAFIVGLITAVFGGRPGMISGATGALAVVMVSLVAVHGVEYLFATVVLMGLIQIAAGVFRLGKFIRLVPHPVMLGFVNGLAIVIFLAQLSQFQVPGSATTGGHGMADGQWMTGWPLVVMAAILNLSLRRGMSRVEMLYCSVQVRQQLVGHVAAERLFDVHANGCDGLGIRPTLVVSADGDGEGTCVPVRAISRS